MNYQIRNAKQEDLERIQEIYAIAREFMAQNGNPDQWGSNYPPQSCLEQDILRGELFVLENQSRICGVFYFSVTEDPTYAEIFGGSWRSDSPYGVIHRIAGDGSGGILSAAVSYAQNQISHIRIDTHEDNTVMQKALAKQGFQMRGTIYIEDGSPRYAYGRLTE